MNTRFDGRLIRLTRDEAEFIVDACEKTRIPQWMGLAAEVRASWGMAPYPAGAVAVSDYSPKTTVTCHAVDDGWLVRIGQGDLPVLIMGWGDAAKSDGRGERYAHSDHEALQRTVYWATRQRIDMGNMISQRTYAADGSLTWSSSQDGQTAEEIAAKLEEVGQRANVPHVSV